jgi:hypothetical protein
VLHHRPLGWCEGEFGKPFDNVVRKLRGSPRVEFIANAEAADRRRNSNIVDAHRKKRLRCGNFWRRGCHVMSELIL